MLVSGLVLVPVPVLTTAHLSVLKKSHQQLRSLSLLLSPLID